MGDEPMKCQGCGLPADHLEVRSVPRDKDTRSCTDALREEVSRLREELDMVSGIADRAIARANDEQARRIRAEQDANCQREGEGYGPLDPWSDLQPSEKETWFRKGKEERKASIMADGTALKEANRDG